MSVVLFGSQASNKSTEFSDYDILIMLDKDYNRSDETNMNFFMLNSQTGMNKIHREFHPTLVKKIFLYG